MRELWIDYMEGEIDKDLKQSLELLLSHSEVDRKVLQRYQRLRRLIKNSESDGPVLTTEYFSSLHNAIMTGVEVSARENRKRAKTRKNKEPNAISVSESNEL